MNLRLKSLLIMGLINYGSCFGMSIATVVNQPGYYRFSPSGPYNPTINSDSYCYITSGDVIIDLSERTYIQTGTALAFNGITLAPGISNVTIKNGVFKNFTGYGIYIADGCSDITIDNILTISCAAGGIICDGSTYGIAGISIAESAFSGSLGVNGGAAYGGIFNNTTFIDMVHVYFTNNFSYTASGYGAYFYNSETCHFTNTVFLYNGGTPFGVGAYFKNCNDCKILYCAGSNNYTLDNLSTSTAAGFIFDSTKTAGMAYCIGSNNVSQAGCGIGFSAYDGISNVFDQCDGQSNVGGNIGAGFVMTGTESASHIIQAYAFSNQGGNAGYGILFDGAIQSSALNCILNNNQGLAGLAYLDTYTMNNNIFRHNSFYNNSTQANSD